MYVCIVFLWSSTIFICICANPLLDLRMGKNFSNRPNQRLLEAVQEWRIYKLKYGKNYTEPEETRRFFSFLKNQELVHRHNINYALHKTTYKLSINYFADMLPEEQRLLSNHVMLKRTLLGGPKLGNSQNSTRPKISNKPFPKKIDWREKGYVTSVKFQGLCGACWAFAVTGALEGQLRHTTGQLIELSTQNIIDCTYELGGSCSGGNEEDAFRYISIYQNGRVDTTTNYPYVGHGQKCRYNNTSAVGSFKGYINLPFWNPKFIKWAIANVGPVAAALGHDDDFYLYNSGIFKCSYICNPDKLPPETECDLSHAVLIVGYDKDEYGREYWIVKNSFGKDWGEDGYFRIFAGVNECGIEQETRYPTI